MQDTTATEVIALHKVIALDVYAFMGKHPKPYSPGALILTFIPIEPHNIHLR